MEHETGKTALVLYQDKNESVSLFEKYQESLQKLSTETDVLIQGMSPRKRGSVIYNLTSEMNQIHKGTLIFPFEIKNRFGGPNIDPLSLSLTIKYIFWLRSKDQKKCCRVNQI